MCRRKLLRSRTLARKVYKSLMSEGERELKWTCPLCSDMETLFPYNKQAALAKSRGWKLLGKICI